MNYKASIKIVFSLFLLFQVVSCTTENDIENKPADYIAVDEFADLLYDINILEGGLTNLNMNQDYMKDSAMKMYKGLFESYDITYDIYKKNQDYYILTSQYKEISQTVLERVKAEEEKYKDVTPTKMLSFTQLSQFLEEDGYLNYFKSDTTTTYTERLDSVLKHYRINQYRLESLGVDSISFEININKFKKGSDLFQRKESVFNKKPTNE